MIALTPPAAAEWLDWWQAACTQHPLDRALTLAAAFTGLPRDELARLSIGERDALLLRIRRFLAGDVLQGIAPCAACGQTSSFTLHAAELPQPRAGQVAVQAGGLRLRVRRPDSTDLAAVLGIADLGKASRALLERCLQGADRQSRCEPASCEPAPREPAPCEWDDALITMLEAALDEAEGLAALELSFVCSDCGAANSVAFDVAPYAWGAFNDQALALLDDVDTLASAYGWREADILALPSQRRTLYAERLRQ